MDRTGERIYPWLMTESDPQLALHLERYRFAAEAVRKGDKVVDVACGVGYGTALLASKASIIAGVDEYVPALDLAREHYAAPNLIYARMDLDRFTELNFPLEALVALGSPVDSAVSLETIEHLREPIRFVELLKRDVGRSIVLSTPVVPTVGKNPFHRHDFTAEDVRGWFRDGWRIEREMTQAEGGRDPVYLVLEARRCA